jgi:hypothetical protein
MATYYYNERPYFEYSSMKDVASSSAVLGTWTFQTHTKSDVGYYTGSTFVVMHLMTDPLSMLGCQRNDCSELDNQICET